MSADLNLRRVRRRYQELPPVDFIRRGRRAPTLIDVLQSVGIRPADLFPEETMQ